MLDQQLALLLVDMLVLQMDMELDQLWELGMVDENVLVQVLGHVLVQLMVMVLGVKNVMVVMLVYVLVDLLVVELVHVTVFVKVLQKDKGLDQ